MLSPIFKLIGTNYIGNLSDIIRRRKALLITSTGLTVTLLCSGGAVTAGSFVFFAIARSLMGLFGGSKAVAMAAIVDSVPKEERSRSISIANFGYTLGVVVGPLMGAILSDKSLSPYFNLAFPFYIAGAVCLLSVIWIYFTFKETFGEKKRRQFCFSEFYKPFVRAFTHPKTQILFPQSLFLDLGVTTYQVSLWSFLTVTLKYTATKMGIFMSVQGAIFLVSSVFLVTPLTHFYCTEKLITISLAIMTFLILLQSFFIEQTFIWAIMIPMAACIQISYTCIYANVSHAVGSHHQGWAMGMASGAFSISWLFGSFATNLIDIIGLQYVLLISVGCLLLSFGLIILHRYRFHPHRLEEEINPKT